MYRARDTKLGRDVALKVLPEEFSNDPDRMARFEREAQVLASLNHPNIATTHGLEEASGVRALVMELVDGPTLADRIAATCMKHGTSGRSGACCTRLVSVFLLGEQRQQGAGFPLLSRAPEETSRLRAVLPAPPDAALPNAQH